MYNLTTQSAGTAKIKFDLNQYRKTKIEDAITSGKPEAERIINYLKGVEDASPDKYNEAAMIAEISNWILKSWQFDIEDSELRMIGVIENKMPFALDSKAGGPKILSESRIGDDINIEHISVKYNQPDDMDRLQRNYRYLLTGLRRMADAVGKKNMSGLCMKTAYTNWLYLINDLNTTFIQPLTARNPYRNSKEPNKIIDSYTKSGGVSVEERMEDALNAYSGAHLKSVEIGRTLNSFMVDLFYLFRLCLDEPILTPQSKAGMDREAIDREIERMAEKFPDEKFTEEFIRKTATLEDWARYAPDDLKNEFGIKPMKFELAPLELPNLEKVSMGRYVETVSERETLAMAFSMAITEQGEAAALFQNVYQNRMTALERTETTYQLKKFAQDSEIQLRPTQLTTGWKTEMGFGKPLANRLDIFSSTNLEEVNKETKEYIDKLIEYHVDEIVRKLISDYRRNDWSIRLLESENPELELKKQIYSTLGSRNGIVTIMQEEINITNSARMSIESLGIKQDTPKSLSTNYHIVTPTMIIIPRVRSVDNEMQLSLGGYDTR